jgi:hypothetical protein
MNPDIREASIDGALAVGTPFHWKAEPGTIRSTFRAVDDLKTLGWTGKTMGIPAIHVYRLKAIDSGTEVTLEESWDGVLSRLFRGRFQKMLDSAVHGGLESLKAEAERRAA